MGHTDCVKGFSLSFLHLLLKTQMQKAEIAESLQIPRQLLKHFALGFEIIAVAHAGQVGCRIRFRSDIFVGGTQYQGQYGGQVGVIDMFDIQTTLLKELGLQVYSQG